MQKQKTKNHTFVTVRPAQPIPIWENRPPYTDAAELANTMTVDLRGNLFLLC